MKNFKLGVRIWQCEIRGEVVKSVATVAVIVISIKVMQSVELIQVLLKRQRTF